MEKIEIVQLNPLSMDEIQPLSEESRNQGIEFVDRLVSEYISGVNQFQKPGEALFGVYHDRQLIAVGGLNRDPCSNHYC
jgi:hypothetical protein